MQYDQGEARFGQVRGTSADLTSVTINGNRLPSAEGGTRNVQLDLIPADMIQTVELNKVVTSDMDGDAIGGEINLVTKSTPTRRILSANVGSGYSWISEKPALNLGLSYGDTFLDGKLGLMLSGSYQIAPGGSDNTEFTYELGDDGQVALDKAEVRQYYVTRERQSYSAALNYSFNADHKIALKAIYNRRNDWENRYRVTYKKLAGKESKQSVVLQTKGGADDTRDARLERQQTLDLTLDGEHQLGLVATDWAVSFSRATEDRPNERYFGVSLKEPFSDSFVDVGARQPYSTKAIPAISDAWKIDELSNSDQHIYENEWKGRLNFTLPLGDGARYGLLKLGIKDVNKTKDKEMHNFDYIDAYDDSWQEHMTAQVRSGFMPGSQYPIGTPFIDKKYLSGIDFGKMEGKEIFEDAAGNYHARENVLAGFLRYDLHLNRQMQLTAGLRVENTHLKYSGFNWVVTDDDETLTPTGDFKNSYTNLLPSLLYKWDLDDQTVLRASLTKTLARPKYSDLVPSVSYSVSDETASIGNPDLKPTTSYNFDLGIDHYFKSVGLVSAGIFYKDLHNAIVSEVWKGSASQIPATQGAEYEVSRPINAYDGSIFGVEMAYERDFGFIAPALSCIGFYGTYTYTHSTTRNYKFEHRQVADGEKVLMQGAPRNTANASLFFKKWGLMVRLSYNTASSFLDEMGETAALDRHYDHVNYLDLNASYTFGRKFRTTIYADATNLLNQPLRYYQGNRDRTMQVEYYGVRINAGVKINL